MAAPDHALTAPEIPGFPPGVNPETFRIRAVNRLLKRSAYLTFDSAPRESAQVGGSGAAPFIDVAQDLRRFEIQGERPTETHGVRVVNRAGETVGTVRFRWALAPDDFNGEPGAPPPTALDPTRSQKFVLLDGAIRLRDGSGSGLQIAGSGRTFPVTLQGKPLLLAAATAVIIDGAGSLRGLNGAIALSGCVHAPDGIEFGLYARFLDPAATLASRTIEPLGEVSRPASDWATMLFLGETNPDVPVTLNQAPDGTILGSNVHEYIRLVETDFDIGSPSGIHARTTEGPVCGFIDATLHFNPMDPRPVRPISTSNGVFRFIGASREEIGTLRSNMTEGQAFATPVAGAPLPLFRFCGFGPILGGTGAFDGAAGMLSLNGAVSVFPRTLSNLYVLRIFDPSGDFRIASRKAWGMC